MRKSKLNLTSNPKVEEVLNSYPTPIPKKLNELRQLILETASEIESVSELEEALKWGEPSYLAQKGSTVRIDWKKKKPDQYAIYFKCTSKLVATFKEVYPTIFKYEGKRAIVFSMTDEIPVEELKLCIGKALTYHTVKHLPLLGFSL